MNNSAIEWTDTTWNPVTGCTKVSQGCKNCYAERMFARPYPGRDFTDVRTHPDRLEQPLRLRKPKRIFVNSMSDLFHESVSDDFIDKVFETMIEADQHTFQILTKRPARMLAFLSERKWPRAVTIKNYPLRNVWLGVSVEDQATADERIPLLLQTPAAVRFISAEPLLGPVDLTDHLMCLCGKCGGDAPLHLVIAGGESGPHARPSHPDWFRSLRDQCDAAGTAFFFKQWGEWAPTPPDVPEPGATRHHHLDDESYPVYRVGKKTAGRTLDGREHNELPA